MPAKFEKWCPKYEAPPYSKQCRQQAWPWRPVSNHPSTGQTSTSLAGADSLTLVDDGASWPLDSSLGTATATSSLVTSTWPVVSYDVGTSAGSTAILRWVAGSATTPASELVFFRQQTGWGPAGTARLHVEVCEPRPRAYAAIAAAERKRSEAAAKKAEELLISALSQEQRRQYKWYGWFLVRGSEGRIYRIRRGRVANVDLICPASGRPLERYCCHPAEFVPDGDTALAQKLMLESMERVFLATANKHGPPLVGADRVEIPLGELALLPNLMAA